MNFLFIVAIFFLADRLIREHLLASVSASHFMVFRLELHHEFSLYAGCCNLGVNVLLSDWCHSFEKRLKNYFTTCLIFPTFISAAGNKE